MTATASLVVVVKLVGNVCFWALIWSLLPVDSGVESPPATVLSESLAKSAPAGSAALQDASSLVNLLSKVDVSPVDLLSALSKVQKPSSFDGESSSPD